MKRPVVFAAIAAGAIALVLAPFLLSDLNMRFANLAMISAIAALGLTVAFGYTGLILIGQATFVGLGAYTSAILTTRLGWSPWPAMVAAALTACVFAAVVGATMSRLKGHYLALATVGLNVSFELIAKTWVGLTGGFDGISSIPPLSVAGLAISGDRRIYWLLAAILVTACIFVAFVRYSHLGRNMVAVRDDEIAAQASGVNVWLIKVKAMAIAGFCGGVSGSLFAHYAAYISPSDFALVRSIELLAINIVGGETSIIGAVIGSLFFTYLPEWLRVLGKEAYPTYFGLITLGVLILLPNGIMGLLRSKET